VPKKDPKQELENTKFCRESLDCSGLKICPREEMSIDDYVEGGAGWSICHKRLESRGL
jgi:hypothetical protein